MHASTSLPQTDSRSPLRAVLTMLSLAAAVVVLRQLAIDTEVDLPKFFQYAPNMLRIGSGVFQPDWGVLPMLVKYTRETIEMAAFGTFLGAVVAIPISFLAARNLMRRSPGTTAIYFVIRSLLSLIRTVPTLFWGLLFVVAAGPGPFAGVLAIAVFTIGLLAKLFSEAIEGIDQGQIDAVAAAGGTPSHIVQFGVIPQVVPALVAHVLYSFEVNTHSAFVLGFVGGGGLGFIILEFIQQFMYRATGMALIVTTALTLTIDYTSAWLRARLA